MLRKTTLLLRRFWRFRYFVDRKHCSQTVCGPRGAKNDCYFSPVGLSPSKHILRANAISTAGSWLMPVIPLLLMQCSLEALTLDSNEVKNKLSYSDVSILGTTTSWPPSRICYTIRVMCCESSELIREK